MTAQSREGQLAESFIFLADTLVVGYDVVDLLHTLVETCATVLDAAAVGLVLANSDGVLEVVAATNERSRVLEMLQLDAGFGPCVECYSSGTVVSLADVRVDNSQWRAFCDGALEQGFLSVHAVPLRLRGITLGALNLFRETTGPLNAEDAAAAQALADVATIGIMHERTLRQSEIRREQLQRALDSRVIIEQAKGVIAQSGGLDMNDAFAKLRGYSRSRGLALSAVAQQVVERTLVL